MSDGVRLPPMWFRRRCSKNIQVRNSVSVSPRRDFPISAHFSNEPSSSYALTHPKSVHIDHHDWIFLWVTPTAGHANNDKVLIAMTLFIQDAKGYYAHKIFQVAMGLCRAHVYFRDRLWAEGPPACCNHDMRPDLLFLLCYLIIDKPIWQVDLVDGQTLQFRTKRTVDSINVTAVTRLVLTNVDAGFYRYYRTKVITEGRAWKWSSTEIDAMRFVDAMLAINPQIPIDRRYVD